MHQVVGQTLLITGHTGCASAMSLARKASGKALGVSTSTGTPNRPDNPRILGMVPLNNHSDGYTMRLKDGGGFHEGFSILKSDFSTQCGALRYTFALVDGPLDGRQQGDGQLIGQGGDIPVGSNVFFKQRQEAPDGRVFMPLVVDPAHHDLRAP